jgi:hypothetical protein
MRVARAPLLLLAAVALGCGSGEPAAQPSPAAAVPAADGPAVTLDGVALGLARPPATLPARLADTLPAGAPAWDSLAEVRVLGPSGQKLFFAHPDARPRPQDLRWISHNGALAVGLVDLPPEGASDALRAAMTTPSRIVPGPVTVQLFTVRPEPEAATWPALPVSVDGAGAGRIRQDEVVGLPTVVEPGRVGADGAAEHAPGWSLAAVVALRVPLEQVASVELSAGAGAPVSISGADLRGDAVLQLKVTRKGAWNLKRFDGGATTPSLVVRDVKQLSVARTPGG